MSATHATHATIEQWPDSWLTPEDRRALRAEESEERAATRHVNATAAMSATTNPNASASTHKRVQAAARALTLITLTLAGLSLTWLLLVVYTI
jgi:hypothetical protein